MIKPSPIPNPVKDSKLHSALNRELKIKSNAGTIFERNELQKVFHQRRIKSSQKEVVEEKTAEDPLFKEVHDSYSAFRTKYKIWGDRAYLK